MLTSMLIGGAINDAVLALLTLAVPRLTRKLLFAVLVFAAGLVVELAGIAIYGAIGSRDGSHIRSGARGLRRRRSRLRHPERSEGPRTSASAPPASFEILRRLRASGGRRCGTSRCTDTGPGRAFAPAGYTVPCLTYDIAVAAMVAIAIVSGRIQAPTSA
jgi:hypothetical protein